MFISEALGKLETCDWPVSQLFWGLNHGMMLVHAQSTWEIGSGMSFVSSVESFNDLWRVLPDVCICCFSSWLGTGEAQCYQLPRSGCSAGSQIPLITCYSSQPPSEFLVFWEWVKDELFQDMFGCWVLGWGVLEPSWTGSWEPAVHVSYQLHVQWHQVGKLKSAKVW